MDLPTVIPSSCQLPLATSPSPRISSVSVPVCTQSKSNNNALYDLQFIDAGSGEYLLVVSGDPGVKLYKWSRFEAAIAAAIDGTTACVAAPKKPKCQDPPCATLMAPPESLSPIASFQTHPSPATSYGESIEINSTSYSKSDGVLFGAAGDAFGCYQWDLGSERLLGTFGGAGRPEGCGHRDYLHVVKAIQDNDGTESRYVVTGGEDGNMGLWNGKDRKLIEMMNMQTTMDKNKSLITSNDATTSSYRGFLNSTSSSHWNSGSNLWVSSMDTNGDWLAVCGGSETGTSNSLTSKPCPSSGFVTLWHLPTRTFTSGCITRESVNAVAYNQFSNCFVTGGNECRISWWETARAARAGRSWSTPPATYTISVEPESNLMIVGGSGGVLDRFVDRVKVSQLQV